MYITDDTHIHRHMVPKTSRKSKLYNIAIIVNANVHDERQLTHPPSHVIQDLQKKA